MLGSQLEQVRLLSSGNNIVVLVELELTKTILAWTHVTIYLFSGAPENEWNP